MSKPPRGIAFAPPPEPEAPANLHTASAAESRTRYLNVRLPDAKFKEIKTAALARDMDLGSYIVFLHDQNQERG